MIVVARYVGLNNWYLNKYEIKLNIKREKKCEK